MGFQPYQPPPSGAASSLAGKPQRQSSASEDGIKAVGGGSSAWGGLEGSRSSSAKVPETAASPAKSAAGAEEEGGGDECTMESVGEAGGRTTAARRRNRPGVAPTLSLHVHSPSAHLTHSPALSACPRCCQMLTWTHVPPRRGPPATFSAPSACSSCVTLRWCPPGRREPEGRRESLCAGLAC